MIGDWAYLSGLSIFSRDEHLLAGQSFGNTRILLPLFCELVRFPRQLDGVYLEFRLSVPLVFGSRALVGRLEFVSILLALCT